MRPDPVILGVVAALGLILGSFVTALSYRLPRGQSVTRGRSQCTGCGKVLAPIDLVPVLSWVLSRGRCRQCGAPISWRYPLTELATLAAALSAAWFVTETAALVLVLMLLPALMTLAIIDLQWQRLPDPLIAWV